MMGCIFVWLRYNFINNILNRICIRDFYIYSCRAEYIFALYKIRLRVLHHLQQIPAVLWESLRFLCADLSSIRKWRIFLIPVSL